MKYIRKIASLVIIFVLLASIVIGIGVIFAVKNVNVTLQSYAYAEDSEGAKAEIARYKSLILGEVRGTIIAFVGEEEVKEQIADSNYTLISFEKVYPCTLNIVLCERKETYAVQSGEGAVIYDADGAYLRTATGADEALNPIDNAPNVYIEGAQTEEEVAFVATLGAVFEKNFAPLRSTVASISYQPAQSQFAQSRVVFRLRCGLRVEIQDFETLADLKTVKAHEVFASLSGEDKLGGVIYSFNAGEGASATYNRNGTV